MKRIGTGPALAMSHADLTCGKDGAVARIAFNRPARRNALGDTTTRQLRAACEEAIADGSVRVIVITGEGEAFCAGVDFKDTFERGAGKTEAEWRERIRTGPNELVRCLAGSPKPVIASVNGGAVGGARVRLPHRIRSRALRLPFAPGPRRNGCRGLARAVGFRRRWAHRGHDRRHRGRAHRTRSRTRISRRHRKARRGGDAAVAIGRIVDAPPGAGDGPGVLEMEALEPAPPSNGRASAAVRARARPWDAGD
jgi:hypothetical protein